MTSAVAVSDSYLSFVLEQLGGVRHVVTKRMFGGVGVYSDGQFFAVIDNDALFVKVDDALARRYRERDAAVCADSRREADDGLLPGAAGCS